MYNNMTLFIHFIVGQISLDMSGSVGLVTSSLVGSPTTPTGGGDKFIQLLRTTLDSLAQLLDVASLVDLGKYCEELLGYLQAIIAHEPTKAVLCVQQVRVFVCVSVCVYVCVSIPL